MNTHEITQKAMQLVLQGNGNKAINGQALAEYEIGQVKSRFIWMDGTETIVPAAQVEEFFRNYWPEKIKHDETSYRLEYNVNQQVFHMENLSKHNPAVPNTFGWFTVYDSCTELDADIFESFVNRAEEKNNEPLKLTKDYIKQSVIELKKFISNLSEVNIVITRD